MQESYLSFIIGKETFAINVKHVLEVIENPSLITPPNLIEYILGIMEFRGRYATVFNTHLRFGFEPNSEKSVVIVMEVEFEGSRILLGAKVDKVKGVINIFNRDILPVPDMGASKNTFFNGLVKDNEKHIMIINPQEVFSHKELKNIAEQIVNIHENEEENGK